MTDRMTAGEAWFLLAFEAAHSVPRIGFAKLSDISRDYWEERAQRLISDAAAIRARMGEVDGWHPMSEAPRDETSVWLWSNGINVPVLMRWTETIWIAEDGATWSEDEKFGPQTWHPNPIPEPPK